MHAKRGLSVIDQRTAKWFQQRCGKVTASRISDVVAIRKDGRPTEARTNYMAEVIAEQLTGDTYEHYFNRAMEWGIEQEPYARSAYEISRDTLVEEVGFIQHPRIEMAGASPDGHVGDDGMIEIKCPTTATHIKTLLSREADPRYIPQMQWQMACTGRAWCDFASFDPRMPDDLQLFVVRVPRDDEYIAELESAVVEFLAEVDEAIRAIRGGGNEQAAITA